MDINDIAVYMGVASPIIQGLLSYYTSFRKTNVEIFFKKLLESGKDISKIGKRDDLQRYLFSIVDKVSIEANVEKIEKWKNATIHLAQDFSNFNYKDNFIRTLNDLTVFDLTVLYKIYSTDFQKEHFENELIEYFVKSSNASKDMIMQAIKRLSSHHLVSEMVDRTAVYGSEDGEPSLGNLYYQKNNLGKKFIEFISNENTF